VLEIDFLKGTFGANDCEKEGLDMREIERKMGISSGTWSGRKKSEKP